jgi:hypothetical protein
LQQRAKDELFEAKLHAIGIRSFPSKNPSQKPIFKKSIKNARKRLKSLEFSNFAYLKPFYTENF